MVHIITHGDGHWELLGNKYWPNTTTNYDLDTLALACLFTQPGKHIVYLDDFAMTTKSDSIIPYDFLDGSSMATPFVAGAVGTLSNIYENDTALQLKERIITNVRKKSNLTNKVASGGVLDLANVIVHTTGITLDKTTTEIVVGKKIQLTPTITPEDATIKDVIWTSSDTEVAFVENGEITALAEGTTTITATTKEGGFQATCEVTVEKVKLSSIEITKEPTKKEYIEGQNFDASGMKVTAKYNNDTSKEVTNYTVTDGENLKVGKTNVTISYTEDDVTKIVTQEITVKQNLKISFYDYNEYSIDEKKCLINITPNTTFKDMISHITTNGIITLNNENEKITNNEEIISTGMNLTITLNNESCEFIIVVKGDTNGDGESNLKDLLQVNKHRLNKVQLKDEFLLAGDVTGDNIVDLKDLLKINKFRLGKINQY